MSEPILPLLVEADDLEPLIQDERIRIIDLCKLDTYQRFHIPGALHLDYPRIIVAKRPAMGLAPDDEILEAMRVLGRLSGVFGEPAGVTAMAGLMQARSTGRITGREKIVVMVTGNGLKDVDSAIKASGEPIKVAVDLDEVVEALSRHLKS